MVMALALKMGNLVVGGDRLKGTADEANQLSKHSNLQVEEILLQDQATS